uniref:Proteasome activator complex subunit 3 n=1 Tax=Cairina moschata TaxID=8855 RepID=A0A8C3CEC2_CAIMO
MNLLDTPSCRLSAKPSCEGGQAAPLPGPGGSPSPLLPVPPPRTSLRALLSSSCASPGRAGAAVSSGAVWGRARSHQRPRPGPGPVPVPVPVPVPPPPATGAPVAGTGELLDGEAVEDLEGSVELQRLAAALAHEAHLRGAAAAGPPPLHAAATATGLPSPPRSHRRHYSRRRKPRALHFRPFPPSTSALLLFHFRPQPTRSSPPGPGSSTTPPPPPFSSTPPNFPLSLRSTRTHLLDHVGAEPASHWLPRRAELTSGGGGGGAAVAGGGGGGGSRARPRGAARPGAGPAAMASLLKVDPEVKLKVDSFRERITSEEPILNIHDLTQIHSDMNLPVPDPILLTNSHDGLDGPNMKKRKLEDREETFQGTKVFVMPNGMLKSNQQLVDIIEKVKPEIRLLIEKCNTVKMWVQLLIPRIEDGNNFGVSIQEETVAELRTVESEAASYLDQISRYYITRAKLVSKIAKYPHVVSRRGSGAPRVTCRCFLGLLGPLVPVLERRVLWETGGWMRMEKVCVREVGGFLCKRQELGVVCRGHADLGLLSRASALCRRTTAAP